MQSRAKYLAGVNLLALKFFVNCLKQNEHAQKYVYSRVSKETADKFWIGYAPRTGFVEYLNKHDVTEKDAKDSGLVSFDYDGFAYPRFFNRIIIPIVHAGRIVAFGGRALGDVEPKYLNSRASLLYNKSETLYGIHRARQSIISRGSALVVEGYFDVLVPYDHGIKNCVATCGTAFTKGHAAILKRYTDQVYVMYDGDSAGIAAAKRAASMLKESKIYAGTITIPGNLDPASYISKYGARKFGRLTLSIDKCAKKEALSSK